VRVLMTADAVGGVWTYAADLAVGLREAGVEVVLAVLGPPPDADARSRYAGDLRVVDAPLDWTAETPADVAHAGRLVAELARAERVDLVHLEQPGARRGRRVPHARARRLPLGRGDLVVGGERRPATRRTLPGAPT
jgi:hypothetical protein